MNERWREEGPVSGLRQGLKVVILEAITENPPPT